MVVSRGPSVSRFTIQRVLMSSVTKASVANAQEICQTKRIDRSIVNKFNRFIVKIIAVIFYIHRKLNV